jgi:hypothetical protein
MLVKEKEKLLSVSIHAQLNLDMENIDQRHILPQSGGLKRGSLHTQYQLLPSSDTLHVPPFRQRLPMHKLVASINR